MLERPFGLRKGNLGNLGRFVNLGVCRLLHPLSPRRNDLLRENEEVRCDRLSFRDPRVELRQMVYRR